MESENTQLPVLDSQPLPTTVAATGQNGSWVEDRDGDVGSLAYAPIPPRKSVTVSVVYRIRGRGKPLPYFLEEAPTE